MLNLDPVKLKKAMNERVEIEKFWQKVEADGESIALQDIYKVTEIAKILRLTLRTTQKRVQEFMRDKYQRKNNKGAWVLTHDQLEQLIIYVKNKAA